MGFDSEDFDREVDVSALTRPLTEDEKLQAEIEAAQISGGGFSDPTLIDYVVKRVSGKDGLNEKLALYHNVTGMVDLAAQRGLDHGDGEMPTRDQAWDSFSNALRVAFSKVDPECARFLRSKL